MYKRQDEAVVTLDKYNFTEGFWGTNGITVKNGFTTPEIKVVSYTHLDVYKRQVIDSEGNNLYETSIKEFKKI